jgi:hypothetical protein
LNLYGRTMLGVAAHKRMIDFLTQPVKIVPIRILGQGLEYGPAKPEMAFNAFDETRLVGRVLSGITKYRDLLVAF